VLDDGSYEAIVIDATVEGDDAGQVMHLDLTITTGEHKGEVVSVAATGLQGDEVALLGMPATLTVAGGEPSVRIDH
jgi:hypothetical protein